MLMLVFSSLFLNCEKELKNADAIIKKSIEISGGKLIEN